MNNISKFKQRGEINFLLSMLLLLAITSGVFVGAQTVQKRIGAGTRAFGVCSNKPETTCNAIPGCQWCNGQCKTDSQCGGGGGLSATLPINPPQATQPPLPGQPTLPGAASNNCSSYTERFECKRHESEGCSWDFRGCVYTGGGAVPTTAVDTSGTDCAGVGGQCILSTSDLQECLLAFGQGAHYGSGDPKGCPRFDGYGGLCCKGKWKTGQVGTGGTKPTSPAATAVPTAQPTTIAGCKAYSSFEACVGDINRGCPSQNSCVDEAGNPGGKFCCPPGVVPTPGAGRADLSCLISIGGSSQATLRTVALVPAIKVGDTVQICINIANTGNRFAPVSFYNFYASNPAGTNVVTQEAYAPVLNEGANFEYCRDVPVNLVGTYNIRGAVNTLGQVEEPQNGRDNTCQSSFTVVAAEPTTPPTETPVVNQCSSCVGGTQIRYPRSDWDVTIGNGSIDDCSEACRAYFGSQCDGGTCGAGTSASSCCSCIYSGGSCANLPGPGSGGTGDGGGQTTQPTTPPSQPTTPAGQTPTYTCQNPAQGLYCTSRLSCDEDDTSAPGAGTCPPNQPRCCRVAASIPQYTCPNSSLGRYCRSVARACEDSDINASELGTCPSGERCCAPRPTRVPVGGSCNVDSDCEGYIGPLDWTKEGYLGIRCLGARGDRCVRVYKDRSSCESFYASDTEQHECKPNLVSHGSESLCCPFEAQGWRSCAAYCSASTTPPRCEQTDCGIDRVGISFKVLNRIPIYYSSSNCGGREFLAKEDACNDANRPPPNVPTLPPCQQADCGVDRAGVSFRAFSAGTAYFANGSCTGISYSSLTAACTAANPQPAAALSISSADVNLDGVVTAVDLGLVEVNYGQTVQTKQGPQTANALMISRILTLMQAPTQ